MYTHLATIYTKTLVMDMIQKKEFNMLGELSEGFDIPLCEQYIAFVECVSQMLEGRLSTTYDFLWTLWFHLLRALREVGMSRLGGMEDKSVLGREQFLAVITSH